MGRASSVDHTSCGRAELLVDQRRPTKSASNNRLNNDCCCAGGRQARTPASWQTADLCPSLIAAATLTAFTHRNLHSQLAHNNAAPHVSSSSAQYDYPHFDTTRGQKTIYQGDLWPRTTCKSPQVLSIVNTTSCRARVVNAYRTGATWRPTSTLCPRLRVPT